MLSTGCKVLVVFLDLLTIIELKPLFEDLNNSQLEMRAVFMNCDHDSFLEFDDLESGRLPREELYKHGKLEKCRKKLALTIKLTSDAANSFGEEYVPIEHIYDTAGKKRVRLLNPYVLRLRRDQPRQAYPLQLLDIVTVMKEDENLSTHNNELNRQNREVLENKAQDDNRLKSVINDNYEQVQNDVELKINTLEPTLNPWKSSTQDRIQQLTDLKSQPEIPSETIISQKKAEQQLVYESNIVKSDSGIRNNCADRGFETWKRRKRNEHNIIIESNVDEDKMPVWVAKDTYTETFRTTTEKYQNIKELKTPKTPITNHQNSRKQEEFSDSEVFRTDKKENNNVKDSKKYERANTKTKIFHQRKLKKNHEKVNDSGNLSPSYQNKPFILYAVGEPVFWHAIDVQLFEKSSDSGGKTVWRDVTNGYVRVSSHSPQFQNENVALQYRPLDWVQRNEFAPSKTPLCLLVADNENEPNSMNNEEMRNKNNEANNEDSDNSSSKFIILPEQDILGAEDIITSRYTNYSDSTADRTNKDEKQKNRVVIRMSKTWSEVSKDKNLKMMTVENKLFLTLPNRQTHRAEIDLEARADDNQLVRVGTSGRISIIVSDSTRRSKSIVSIQAANTGLAAARFRVALKDCGPEIATLMKQRGGEPLTTELQLVAPHHTKRFKLELPVALPVEYIHCSVSLINDKGLAVAMRDVVIKNADRCFCVWYCECVCMSEDPKLLCREMADSLLVAAGLTKNDRARNVRNAVATKSRCKSSFSVKRLCCYFLSVMVGLILAGFIKGIVGICYIRVAYFWLDEVLKMPRPMNRYQEPWLRGETVILDKEGWPIHPHTKERNVHLMEYETMLMLNTLLFILMFCKYFCKSVKKVLSCCHCFFSAQPDETNSVPAYNTMQMSTREKRKKRAACAEQWMTPDAEDLSKELWMNSANPLQPALTENFCRKKKAASSLDSERDDTEYVITQMQKSRESLAKCQRNHGAIFNEKSQLKHTEKKVLSSKNIDE